ncbi:hypothetical protein F5051DRAFT_433850 [Lentinula edodes]|nr:hypothetical protein F5051DRAFT_433850 [Lentinula edodes]
MLTTFNQPLKAGEAKDGNPFLLVFEGKENTAFWNDAVNFFAFTQYPAFDDKGNRIENHNVQSTIEGATVALDVVVRGWKFKTDKKWGFALDLKRLSVIAPPEDEAEPELPALPGSQSSTVSAATVSDDIHGTSLPVILSSGEEDPVLLKNRPLLPTNDEHFKTPEKTTARNMARSSNKREGSPLNGHGQTKMARTTKSVNSSTT